MKKLTSAPLSLVWLAAGMVSILTGEAARPDVAAGTDTRQASNRERVTAGQGWTQWGGPDRNFVVADAGLADAWPEAGPPVLWSRELGTGHSAIVSDGERLYTMYRAGNARSRQGPWAAEEVVIALDAATGATVWEHRYPSRPEDFSFGAGPHATPLVAGGRVFTIGTNQQLFAFDARTGRVLWSHDFIRDFGAPELLIRPVVKTGYGCSPLAFGDTILCSVGGPGQSVMAFRQQDGAVVWKSGDFLPSAAAPILIDVAGRPQAVFLGGGTVTGLDPSNGAILWSHPHDPGNDLNCGTPLWGPDNILFVSSAYQAGSRALRLVPRGGVTDVEELWFTNRVRFMFLSSVRVGDHVYGTTGDFGPAFLTAVDVRTGETAWQARGFGRASLVHAGDRTIVMDEDGDLALARLTPEGATILAQAKIFDTVSWTVPTLVGTTLYARDRERIVALALGQTDAAGRATAASPSAGPADAAATGASEAPAPAAAVPVVLAGSWKLDPERSRVAGGAVLPGLIAAGAPPLLFITQPANGTVVIESPINTGHARFYRPGGSTATPIPGGTMAMRSTWDGAALVADGTASTRDAAAVQVRESWSVASDGAALVVEVTRPNAGGTGQTSRLVYTPLESAGPCQSWPTPCKR
jgi:outer membrane protein assembly factor BamB